MHKHFEVSVSVPQTEDDGHVVISVATAIQRARELVAGDGELKILQVNNVDGYFQRLSDNIGEWRWRVGFHVEEKIDANVPVESPTAVHSSAVPV